ncbi:MAG TPA: PepSY-like domain-containing protein [Pontibacter sp.]
MKFLALSVLAASTFSFSFLSFGGQDIPQSEVPAAVVSALTKAYPNASDVEWEKHSKNFEAEFDVDTTDYTVLLDGAGNIVQAKHEIAIAALPETIKNAIATSYKNQKIDDADVLEKNGQTYYQVELEGTLKDTKVVFDNAGKLQKGIAYWD